MGLLSCARESRCAAAVLTAADSRLVVEGRPAHHPENGRLGGSVARGLPREPYDNGLAAIGALSYLFADVEPVDIDTELYGPLEADS
jgi:hypothetical protein